MGVYLLAHLYGLGISRVVLGVKNMPASAGGVKDVGSTPGLGRSPAGGHGNPLQSSCLESPIDRGAWGSSPWGHKESGMPEATEHACMWLLVPYMYS